MFERIRRGVPLPESSPRTCVNAGDGAMTVPEHPKIYHIVHIDRLPSIAANGYLWCDAEIHRRTFAGTTIGMSNIKSRRLHELFLGSHPDLHVGDCVPFNFCPRSVMLYVIYKRNHPELTYRGGQEPIVHLEADLRQVVTWADQTKRRWAFTLTNAASCYFEDYCDLSLLDKIDWDAVHARNWQTRIEEKQAEFLLEDSLPWRLIERIGVYSNEIGGRVGNLLPQNVHRPLVETIHDWYY